MILALILGILVTAAAGLFGYLRGRISAVIVLVLGLVGAIAMVTAFGRDAFTGYSLGSLIGLPVLVWGLRARDKRKRLERSRNGGA